MACGCNQNWNPGYPQGCNRATPCQQAIRQVERDAVEVFRQLEEAEKGVCRLRQDIEALYRQCSNCQPAPPPRPQPRPCGCGCAREREPERGYGCAREREPEMGCGCERQMDYDDRREYGYGRKCGCK